MIAQKAVEKSSVSELAMEYQLHRSRAMTEILQMMDSDNSFEKVAEDILRETCESLEISGGCLLRENTGENTADMICEYTKEPDKSILAEGQHIPIGALPFYNGKTYMISSDSIMPEPFAHLFKTCHISAGIFEQISADFVHAVGHGEAVVLKGIICGYCRHYQSARFLVIQDSLPHGNKGFGFALLYRKGFHNASERIV